MVRGKIEMKKIENATSRQVTFSKRRNGLLKKAYELSVLCDAQLSLIIFSQRGRLYEFSSSDMQKTIERYRKYTKDHETSNHDSQIHLQQLKQEASHMITKIELLEFHKRKLLGQGIASCSLEELQEIDSQLQRSLGKVRERKEKQLLEENVKLHQKNVINPWRGSSTDQQQEKYKVIDLNLEVETDLFIGLPNRNC
ncbi:Transcription factor MADS-box [Arabidopsis thaliana x Arabidopsis arenosa]|uniref:Transcription factor MADS-box n=3 Tax=Arabidopsis TaxID=3701 RepID=A0A8T2DTS6_ARASU|nr:AGAMOUS-like 42 [Arabidopsis thaliana]NP_001330222.1 AGAMOUS-like 42 [Arabidopsis thaliana]KAG7606987.1 Transcription factor MADS-box [Arabidopsis thaliana x Arabidopsis arenosa]KAG7613892.1 Transcription factor MADS-box [Arabidopsis suecica]AED97575.1 AGAMOUS-like 42 [Arabidopsis thaliana]ANM68468.1 AGAMOUS-like 42 [Arabidopsis thaliana]KAG7613893.1 Transcription factor MADS-box [Arabidopsis suecica]|eukprot:NP_001190593.1 AGAMOUS-like 42 [Arabidopsis thaliana]